MKRQWYKNRIDQLYTDFPISRVLNLYRILISNDSTDFCITGLTALMILHINFEGSWSEDGLHRSLKQIPFTKLTPFHVKFNRFFTKTYRKHFQYMSQKSCRYTLYYIARYVCQNLLDICRADVSFRTKGIPYIIFIEIISYVWLSSILSSTYFKFPQNFPQ